MDFRMQCFIKVRGVVTYIDLKPYRPTTILSMPQWILWWLILSQHFLLYIVRPKCQQICCPEMNKNYSSTESLDFRWLSYYICKWIKCILTVPSLYWHFVLFFLYKKGVHKKRQYKYKLGSINIHFLLTYIHLNSKNCGAIAHG